MLTGRLVSEYATGCEVLSAESGVKRGCALRQQVRQKCIEEFQNDARSLSSERTATPELNLA